MGKITFSDDAWAEYVEWQALDKKTLKKINSLIKSIDREGALKGEGKSEKLNHKDGEYSRRINEEDRLVYSVENGKLKSSQAYFEGSYLWTVQF